jgi:exodeoxyribonuclease III
VLCLQETKLQESHLEDPKLRIRETLQEVVDEYDDYWSCSTAKKGYAGTAVFVRKRGGSGRKNGKTTAKKQTTLSSFVAKVDDKVDNNNFSKPKVNLPIDEELLVPVSVSYGIGTSDHDAEGRTITVDFPRFSLCNVYVPNAGQKLERLSYRTDQWDKDFLAYMQTLSTTNKKPVLWAGDLNVAHTHLEVWNDGAKHLAKQAGVTAEERASFQSQLDSGFVDAFRRLHPTAAGHYSYWSTRAGNRPVNKGLRLDYFICHPDFFKADSPVVVRDCYMDFEQAGSDHCPVILEIAMQ